MHDLDRALQELEAGATALDSESYELEEESEGEGEGEEEGDYESPYGFAQEAGDSETVFDEVEELEHAASLLEVQDEGELEQFLGGLVSGALRKLKQTIPPQLRQSLVGTLKNVARSALPTAAAALGNIVAPGVGGAVAGRLASQASKMFGLELEGMSYEDQEFEVARRVVGLGGEATKAAVEAAQAAPGVSPTQIAKDAVVQAAQTHAPGLASAATSAGERAMPSRAYRNGFAAGRRTGRWFRRGRRIILVGV